MRFDQARAKIVEDAYRRTAGPVAYLDESYQAPDPIALHSTTFYIFTAVVVEQAVMDELRDGLKEIAGGLYWHTTTELLNEAGQRKTRDMLQYLAEGPEPCVIAHQVAVDEQDHDAENARRSCYRGLAAELVAGAAGKWDPVDLFVLEERNQRNFRNRDNKNHSELIAEKRVSRNTRLLQTSPQYERLLWLPDVVSSAFRRTITHRDSSRRLFEIIKDQVHFVQPVD